MQQFCGRYAHTWHVVPPPGIKSAVDIVRVNVVVMYHSSSSSSSSIAAITAAEAVIYQACRFVRIIHVRQKELVVG